MTIRYALLLGLLAACNSGPGKPSNDEVGKLIQALAERRTYFDFSKVADGEANDFAQCGVQGGSGRITSLTITAVEYSEYNTEKKYWPAKVNVKGVCVKQVPNCGENNNSLCPPEDSEFVLEGIPLSLQQDDFQKWSASVLK